MGRFFLLVFAALILFSACEPEVQNSVQVEEEKKKPVQRVDSAGIMELARFDLAANAPNAWGLIGVFNIPEMLALVKLDSAVLEDIANKRAQAFADIEADIAYTGAVMEGSPGSIYYTNDPKNFKFECLMLIKDLPPRKPLKSEVIVLEASPKLIYNHKGP